MTSLLPLLPNLSLSLIEDAPQGGLSMFMPLILIGVIFYFLLIRPEGQKRKEHENFLGNLSKGDKVMTNAGILGTVRGIQDDVVTLEVAQNVRMRFVRGAIQGFADPEDAKKSEDKPQDNADAESDSSAS